ncbi:hypothetical protein ACT29H_07240 [Thermophagus sp. OGC60D27]|uniref:hypothetical protein n=1 Tax=Thermophagus sp. OGC60D27 TaxID=3458415 RepID=UPI00403770AF
MSDENYSVQISKEGDSQVVTFSGQLTINYIQNIKDLVGKKIHFSKDIVVKVENPDNLDITFLQLLESIKATAESNQRKFSASGSLPDELLSLISNSGFSKLLSCNPVNK